MEGEFDRFWYSHTEAARTESIRFQSASPCQNGIASVLDFRAFPPVHLVGSEVVQSAVHVLAVVPSHESVDIGSGLLQRAEVLGERCSALEGRKQALDESIVVADMGSAVSVADIGMCQRDLSVSGHL